MRNRFIILVDFSAYSANLIRYACDWARQADAELLLVHQVLAPAPAMADPEMKQVLAGHALDEAQLRLDSLAKELVPPDIGVSVLAAPGPMEVLLVKLLGQPYRNLVFTGLKGTGLLKQMLMGSVALRVIEHTGNIVVAIPGDIDSFTHRKLFVAVSDEHPLHTAWLDRLLDFIDSKGTEITFFHLAGINEHPEGMDALLRDLAARYADRFATGHEIYEGDDPFAAIREVINDRTEEILVVQKGSRLLTDQLFRKFLINDLVFEGRTPLIVLP